MGGSITPSHTPGSRAPSVAPATTTAETGVGQGEGEAEAAPTPRLVSPGPRVAAGVVSGGVTGDDGRVPHRQKRARAVSPGPLVGGAGGLEDGGHGAGGADGAGGAGDGENPGGLGVIDLT